VFHTHQCREYILEVFTPDIWAYEATIVFSYCYVTKHFPNRLGDSLHCSEKLTDHVTLKTIII